MKQSIIPTVLSALLILITSSTQAQENGAEVFVQFGHSGEVNDLVMFEDGSYLISSGQVHSIIIMFCNIW